MSDEPRQLPYEDPIIAEANQEWDRQLRADPPSIDDVVTWQAEHFLTADQPLCRVMRPNFVTTQQLAADRQAAGGVMSALVRAGDRIAADPILRERYLGDFWHQYAEFQELDCGYPQPCINVRLDAYATRDGLRFLELNTSAGGSGRAGLVARMFAQFAAFQRFTEHFRVEHLLTGPTMRAAVLNAYHAWGGQGQPTAAALHPQPPEMTKLRQLAIAARRAGHAKAGHDFRVIDPAELSFEGGRLRHGTTIINIVFRGVISQLHKFGRPALQALLSAARARAVFVINPLSIHGHKAIFAAVTDSACDFGLTTAERHAVREHVPWTRVVREERTTDPAGGTIELLRWASEHREQLVLKPTAEHGGKGVVLGWETAAAAWEQSLQEAQSAAASHILQARVEPTTTTWPLLAPGFPDTMWIADRSPYLAAGQLVSYYTRMGTAGITNVSSGGSIVPTLILHGRV